MLEMINNKERPKVELHKKELNQTIERLKEIHADEILRKKLCSTLDQLGISATVKVRIKTLESALAKVNRGKFSKGSAVMDLLGGMIITHSNDLNEIYAIKNSLCKNNSLFVAKDYFANPKPSGYRSYHLYLNMKDIGLVEIHLDTIGVSKAQMITHDSVYKPGTMPQELDSWLLSMSKKIYDYYSNDGYHQIDPSSSHHLLHFIEQEKLKIKNLSKDSSPNPPFSLNHQFQKRVLRDLTSKIEEVEKRHHRKNDDHQISSMLMGLPLNPVFVRSEKVTRRQWGFPIKSTPKRPYHAQFVNRKIRQPNSMKLSLSI
jgi:ppGpp synthetase/RelA/SpoT-type nucleotidyltranferase